MRLDGVGKRYGLRGAVVQSASWPAGVPLLAAVALLAVSWLVSARLAARRTG